MPRYTYRCINCSTRQDIFHLADEKPSNCVQCNDPDNLVKLLRPITTRRKIKRVAKTGDTTEEFIENSRQELEQQKEALLKK